MVMLYVVDLVLVQGTGCRVSSVEQQCGQQHVMWIHELVKQLHACLMVLVIEGGTGCECCDVVRCRALMDCSTPLRIFVQTHTTL